MEKRLGLRGDDKIRWLADPSRCANNCLLDYWRGVPDFPLETARFWWFAGHFIRQELNLATLGKSCLEGGVLYPHANVLYEWGDRDPILTVSPGDICRGKEWLSMNGLDPSQPFVALHFRGAGYDARRNVDPETYSEAIDFLVERGFNVVRVRGGAPIRERKGLIQIDTLPNVESWVDIFVLGAAKFCLGCASGPTSVANVFGTPVLFTNYTPMGEAFVYRSRDVCLPRVFRHKTTGELAKFSEILEDDLATFYAEDTYREALDKSDFEMVSNTPAEILESVCDMIRKLEVGKDWLDVDDVRRQDEFRQLFNSSHYSFRGRGFAAPSFLKKYEALI